MYLRGGEGVHEEGSLLKLVVEVARDSQAVLVQGLVPLSRVTTQHIEAGAYVLKRGVEDTLVSW